MITASARLKQSALARQRRALDAAPALAAPPLARSRWRAQRAAGVGSASSILPLPGIGTGVSERTGPRIICGIARASEYLRS